MYNQDVLCLKVANRVFQVLHIHSFLPFLFRFVDVGVYGVPKNPAFETVSTTRKIESFVRDVKG